MTSNSECTCYQNLAKTESLKLKDPLYSDFKSEIKQENAESFVLAIINVY